MAGKAQGPQYGEQGNFYWHGLKNSGNDGKSDSKSGVCPCCGQPLPGSSDQIARPGDSFVTGRSNRPRASAGQAYPISPSG